ncbi:pyridoxal phosphate-dependent aminotransferase [Laspinema sp. A4]|uniref:pyridoxal phosphate-dependent aminotransferase n=1 Tax=Laspinema sp. D2d TaxID=2953686 RepID=UPI0021BB6E59|nr:pyridoxal phosphate-dependent aminotransferase [Laspinema sp. D2d]MCT7985432.1 pyridoxal phosphate-dependent aminotransferase [Laspinema sp. D2d]
MDPILSRMEGVQSPIIPQIGELIRAYPGTLSLGQGVVYYPPPPGAFERISECLADANNHKYQAVEGIPALQTAIATKLRSENGIPINEDSKIVVTAGGNMAFMNAILAITSPGDEIIIQTPYYFNHEMAIAIAGCQAVCVATDENYQLCPEAIAAAITDKTRAIVTISPNNPTGVVYSEAALRQINQLCGDRGLYHISDEAYEYFTYDGATHFSPGSIPNSHSHTISLFSLSKAYGFAGWRIGYMVIPQSLLTAVKKIQDTLLICPPILSQYVALGALEAGKDYCLEHLPMISEMRDLCLKNFSELSEFCTVPEAKGAFYFLVKLETKLSPMEAAKLLIEKFGIATIPGTTFGIESGCSLRVSYAGLDRETAVKGINRLFRGLETMYKTAHSRM